MLEFNNESGTPISEYKNGSDDVVHVHTYDELEARITRTVTSLLSHADFQDVVFVLNPNEATHQDRFAIRILFELDPNFEKVTLFVDDENRIPYSAYAVDQNFDLHEIDVGDYLQSVHNWYFATEEAS